MKTKAEIMQERVAAIMNGADYPEDEGPEQETVIYTRELLVEALLGWLITEHGWHHQLDLHVEARRILERAVHLEAAPVPMTEQECETLVCGDEDGNIEQLAERWPVLNDALNYFIGEETEYDWAAKGPLQ